MGANLVNLNVNPCKMCMPMGAVSAFYGLKGCMTILHGSQGCATYIRRHMATHYNEPVDVASSSLTEEGTVFGGETNLIRGIENLISLYSPEIIGVATTCLAETIGENVGAIIRKFYDAHPDAKVKIINASSAGYAGTQYEGFFRVLRAVVEQTPMDTNPNQSVNIIAPMLSPADFRQLKKLLESMGLSYILLPDLSENLDGIHEKHYKRIKSGGTPLGEIARMAGAKYTIELSRFISEDDSPAQYLNEQFGVPFERLAMPAGIRDTDALIEKLVELGGRKTPELMRERGRYIDAMIDSHKYCALGRAAVFGEPDFVYSVIRLCCENGVIPVLAATGSVCPALRPALEEEIRKCADRQLVEKTVILDDCDFDMIESVSRELGVNVMIGSSDGRRAAHRLGVDLVRCAFPIHDRVGGQRVRMIGYGGSLNLLDQIANILLGNQEERFRGEIYDSFFETARHTGQAKKPEGALQTIAQRTASHPCYTCGGGKYARMHLPVAPKCNIQCNYCVRKYDCPNESRPGVTTQVLTPEEALEKYKLVKKQVENLTVVGIAGPGDALANFEQTRDTLRMIREYDPDVTFCLSTNGLMLPLYAQELVDLGVSHVTVTINAVDVEIGAKIYKYVDYMGTRYTGVAAASILLGNQLAGLRYLTEHGIICKVNTVVLRGINEEHIEEVVKKVRDLGAYISNIMQMIPVAGSAFENMELVSNREISEIRNKCSVDLKQMYHCRQCRADAIGMLDNDVSIEFRGGCGTGEEQAALPVKKYAVASKSGMLVDQHFGHADTFYIYESDGTTARFVEKRQVNHYCTGKEDCLDDKQSKMDLILSTVADCSGVLALRIGNAPLEKLESKGIKAVTTYDRIENAVKQAASQ
ncbi:MAG: nitrogenase cofactor biosynthesis protein NifB [Ruminococcaceae bacterium]|nr:nitrogenase cofactor biosynthesis protein NifB [Oscillospiraceae bacterium]